MRKLIRFYKKHDEAIIVGLYSLIVIEGLAITVIYQNSSLHSMNQLFDKIAELGQTEVKHKTDDSLWLFTAKKIEEA